jgi:hypothetical protein
MAHDGRYPASTPGRARGLTTPPQGTTFSTPTVAAHEPLSSESSSLERRAPLLSDAADLRNSHYHRLSASSRGHAAPGSAALPPRRSSSSSSPRARDLDHTHPHHPHYHTHHHHRGRSRGDEIVGVSRQLTALQRVASEIRRLTRTSVHPPAVSEEDWSVFGEAMVHEGVGDAGYTTSTRRTLSPASDAHLEDYIPPVEEEEEEGEEGQENERGSSLETGLHSYVDSDTDSSTTSLVSSKGHSIRGGGEDRWWKRLPSHLPTLPTLYRNILKCSLAYFFGSLFTYYAPLSRFIAELTHDGPGEKYPSAMGHMVATV